MTPRIVAFIRLLRTQGLPVSVAESLDALHSVSQVGVHDRDLLRLTLRTALVKSHRDFPTFDTLFERFLDRKSTRLNSSHVSISYAVFCLKKKNTHFCRCLFLYPICTSRMLIVR